MTSKARVMSLIMSVAIIVTLLSSFCFVQASGGDANKFGYRPFEGFTGSSYGANITVSNMVFVDDNWKSANDGDTVYLKYSENEIYKAIKGINAFGTIKSAVDTVGRENLVIKVGAGEYDDVFTSSSGFEYDGLKFLGNYAGYNPNVATADEFKYDLNPERDPKLESYITGKFTWRADRYNITFDGFKAQNHTNGNVFTMYVSNNYVGQIYMYNNIFDNVNNPFNSSGNAYIRSLVIKNNRFTNIKKTTTNFNGANADIRMEDNYFENCKDSIIYLQSTGGITKSIGGLGTITFQRNVVNGCAKPLQFSLTNVTLGESLAYIKVKDNKFYGCTGEYIIMQNFFPDTFHKEEYITSLDPKSKTEITGNTFANQPENMPVIKFNGRRSYLGTKNKYAATINNNKFIFKDPLSKNNIVLKSDMDGVVDASYNYYNVFERDGLFQIDTKKTVAVTMPSYADESMDDSSLKDEGNIDWQWRAMDKYLKTDDGSYGIDKKNFNIFATVKNGVSEFVFDSQTLYAENTEYQLYYDFMLEKPVKDNKVFVTDKRTTYYMVVTNTKTGNTVKYGLVILCDSIDGSKADFRYLFDASINSDYKNYTISGNTITAFLDSSEVNFPFYVMPSPSATVEYYTDAYFKNAYNDSTYYMQPDEPTVVYAKITSKDKSASNVYKLIFKRKGSEDYDAAVIKAISPMENMQVYNGGINRIVYKPDALVESATFDFEVSTGATYTIYSDASHTNIVSKQGDVKEVKVGEAITYYYVRVTNPRGYSRDYTLVCYNDVKSTDNHITGITGLDDNLTINGDTITIKASPSLALVNAHFETNAFAQVTVYSNEAKVHSIDPDLTYTVVNNREVEVRSFKLGITHLVSRFYVDVKSETGETRSYKVIIYKEGATVPDFTDTKGHWAQQYINEVTKCGIVNGYLNESNNTYTFGPERKATRYEMAVLLCRTFGIEQLAFKNVSITDALTDSKDIPDWAYNFVKGSYTLKFMVGYTDGAFHGQNEITRQEFFQAVASILHLDKDAASGVDLGRFKDGSKVANWAVPATKACIKAGLVEGSGGMLNPTNSITRAEIAKILSKISTIKEFIK